MKTSELKGKALCYTVTMIEMPHLKWGETIGTHWASDQIVVPEMAEPDCYSPFTSWKQCGPIIEREKICVICPSTGDFWDARIHTFPPKYVRGPTALIAAMRCYVASKLGDEVEVPEELSGENHASPS